MEQLFAAITPRRRSPAGTALSAGLHLAVVVTCGVSVTQAGVTGAPQRPYTSITFITSAAPPMAALASEPIRDRATPAVTPPLAPAPEVNPAPLETIEPPAPEPVAPVQPDPAEPEPAPPAAAPVITPPSGADSRASVSVGAFERPSSHGVARAAYRPASVASAGFTSAGAAAAARPAPAGAVRAAGFDLAPAPAAPPRAAAQRPTRIDAPVEILFKPTPEYSDEARALKIEGSVILEVEFGAGSDARVVRVVSGLGHGLDESAARAAEQIRFKPARSAGNAVSFRTTVRIVFRLT